MSKKKFKKKAKKPTLKKAKKPTVKKAKKPALKKAKKPTLKKAKKPALKKAKKPTLKKAKKPTLKKAKKPTLKKAKASSKKLKNQKTLPKKAKSPAKVKEAVPPKIKNQELKKTSQEAKPVDAKKKPLKKTSSKSFIPSLKYREKELQKLLEKEREETLIVKDMEGRKYCLVENCDYPAIVEDYCRIHFFGLFKIINKKKEILEQDLLTKGYLSLIKQHSETIFEYLFKDLSSDKNFKLAIKKLVDEEIDDLEVEDPFSD